MDNLLQILSDGEYHSGEELGKLLSISRAAIWKQMQKVEALGLPVESQKGRGYRIAGGLDLLAHDTLCNQISPKAKNLLKQLDVQSTVVSTNELAKQRAEEANASGLVIVAEQQTNGRGRRGRQWVSPYGCNLYLSLVWGFDGGVSALEGLSLAVGVAVQKAVIRIGAQALELKWPNDLLWQQRKVGGILLEVIGDPTGFCQVIIGVGLNVDMPEDHAADIDQSWANLVELVQGDIAKNELAGFVVDELLILLSDYHEMGFKHYRDEWHQYDAYADEAVTLSLMGKVVEGVARGVDDTGALRLEIAGEIKVFSGGEVSLRGAK
jgi:BirA family transcriptional regulator, biotin operon repressor / biotin---[acetyl-CoA-carboxylase] ligase